MDTRDHGHSRLWALPIVITGLCNIAILSFTLFFFRTIRFAYALLGFIEATAGMYTYFLLYAENGFFIYDMQMQAKWERKGLNDLVDSYGQEWVRCIHFIVIKITVYLW